MVYNICKNGIVNEEEWDKSDWYNAIAARRSFFIAFHKKKERRMILSWSAFLLVDAT